MLQLIDLMAQRRREFGQRRDDWAGLGLVANLQTRLAGEGNKSEGGKAIKTRNSLPLFGNRPVANSLDTGRLDLNP